MSSIPITANSFDKLLVLIAQNQQALKKVNFSNPSDIDGLNWSGLTRSKKKLTTLLKAYQRLSKIVLEPDKDQIIYGLMKAGISSAIHVASQPKAQFIATYSSLFGSKAVALSCYQRALAVRAQLLIRHMNRR